MREVDYSSVKADRKKKNTVGSCPGVRTDGSGGDGESAYGAQTPAQPQRCQRRGRDSVC